MGVDHTLVKDDNTSPTIIFATAGSCPPLPLVNNINPSFGCDSFFKYALEIALRPHVKTIVFSAFWESYFGFNYSAKKMLLLRMADDTARTPLTIDDPKTDKVFDAFTDTIRLLQSKGKKVFIILSNPSAKAYDPQNIAPRLPFIANPRGIKRKDFEEYVAPVIDKVKQTAKETGAILIDPMDALCDAVICPTVTSEGKPYYKDSNHIGSSYAREKATFIDQVME